MTPFHPFLRRWARAGSGTAPGAARVAGSSEASRPGPDPDRVLVVGSGPAAGPGATGSAAPLVGPLSTALAGRTGRGVGVEAHCLPQASVTELPDLLSAARPNRFDAIVIVVGTADAASGIPVRRWRRSLAEAVEGAQGAAPRDAVVLLTSVPGAAPTAVRRGPRAVVSDLRIRSYNRAVAEVARTGPGIGVSAVPPATSGAGLGSTAWYRSWADRLAMDLAPLLDAARTG